MYLSAKIISRSFTFPFSINLFGLGIMFIASKEPKPHQILSTYLHIEPNTIWDNPGARKKKRKIGRGPGCTKGYHHSGNTLEEGLKV